MLIPEEAGAVISLTLYIVSLPAESESDIGLNTTPCSHTDSTTSQWSNSLKTMTVTINHKANK